MTFLPSEAVEPKSKSNYTMPLEEGRHKLRVLSSAIVGYEGWKDEGGKKTPVRYKMGTQPELGPDGKEPKYFWSFIVWNYEQERIQIMSVTQKTIREQMKALIDDEAWNSPLEYDIAITRTGMKMDDTKYTVMPNPKVPVSPEILQQYKEKNIDLNAWLQGLDPFSTDSSQNNPYSPQKIDTSVEQNVEEIFADEPTRE